MPPFPPPSRSAPSMISGVRDPLDYESVRIKIEMDDEMYWVLPDASPMLVLLNKVRDTERVENYLVQWLRMEEFPRKGTVTAAVAAGATTIYVSLTESYYFVANHLIECLETEEVMHVTAVNNATGALTVTRSLNGVNQPITAGWHIAVSSTAYPDGASKGTYQSMVEIPDYNYTQCFRRGFGHTFRAKGLGLFGGKDTVTTEQQVSIEHRLDQELSLYYGARYYDGTSYSSVFSTTGGLREFVKTNVWNLGGLKPTIDDFFGYMEFVMRYGAGGYINGRGHKYLVCSSLWQTWFAQTFHNMIQYEPLQEKLGIKANLLATPHGDLVIMKSPILDRNHRGDAWVIDPNEIRRLVFADDDTFLREGIETPGDAKVEKEFYADVGWKITSELSLGRITGLV